MREKMMQINDNVLFYFFYDTLVPFDYLWHIIINSLGPLSFTKVVINWI